MASTVTIDPPSSPQPIFGFSRLNDELLARYAARGRVAAFEAIYERYHQPLYQYCRSILRHDADAQDALQSTFTKALGALEKGQRRAPLRPWLFRIAHNESISLIRSRRGEWATEPTETVFGSVASAEEEAGARERFSTLMHDLRDLPDKQRGALLLRELSGLSHEEIGLALATSTAAAKQCIFEARQALAELAEGRDMGCAEVRRRISDGDRRVLRGRKIRAHVRNCVACSAFASAIPTRQAELRAIVPLLGPAAAAGVLSRALGAAGGHGAGGAAAGPTAAMGAGAAGKLVGAPVVWKALVGAVVLATAAVGASRLGHVHHARAAVRNQPASQVHHAASGHSAAPRGPSAKVAADAGHRRARHGDRGSAARHRHGTARAHRQVHHAAARARHPARRGRHRHHRRAALAPIAPARHHRSGSSGGATGQTGSPSAGNGNSQGQNSGSSPGSANPQASTNSQGNPAHHGKPRAKHRHSAGGPAGPQGPKGSAKQGTQRLGAPEAAGPKGSGGQGSGPQGNGPQANGPQGKGSGGGSQG